MWPLRVPPRYPSPSLAPACTAESWSLIAGGVQVVGFFAVALLMLLLGCSVVGTIEQVPFNVEIRRRKVFEVSRVRV